MSELSECQSTTPTLESSFQLALPFVLRTLLALQTFPIQVFLAKPLVSSKHRINTAKLSTTNESGQSGISTGVPGRLPPKPLVWVSIHARSLGVSDVQIYTLCIILCLSFCVPLLTPAFPLESPHSIVVYQSDLDPLLILSCLDPDCWNIDHWFYKHIRWHIARGSVKRRHGPHVKECDIPPREGGVSIGSLRRVPKGV